MAATLSIERAGLTDLYPFPSRYLEIAGYRMHYIDEGRGPVVLLLHGNPTWSFYFRNLILELRPFCRVIAVDHLGCGLSDHPTNRHFRATERVDHLEELLAKLGVNRFSLVMHDWGGPIGAFLASRNPQRIERMVFLNTTLTETDSLPHIIRRAAAPVIGKFLTKFTKNFLKLTTQFGVAKTLPTRVKRGYLYPYRSISRRTAIWDFVADIPFDSSHPTYGAMLDLAHKLPTLQSIPTLVIWGLRDPCFHHAMFAHVVKSFPKAKVIEIAQASHLVLEDAPEIALPAIREFFQELPAERTPEPQSKDLRAVSSAEPSSQHTLYANLIRNAQNQLKQDAVIRPTFLGESVHYTQLSFERLLQSIFRYERGLAELGLCRGDRVLILVKPGAELLGLSYAVMGRGAIPIFVDPGVGKENLIRCIRDANPTVFIGSPKAHLLRLLKRDLFANLKLAIWATDLPVGRGINLSIFKRYAAIPMEPVAASEISLIAFTSGGTGTPKGVVFTNQMLAEQLRIFSDEFGLRAPSKDLPLLPIFSIFSTALGICCVFPPLDPSRPLALDPSEIVRVIHDLNIDSSFGSPTLWNKIAEYCIRYGVSLPSIRKLYMAGAPVSEELLKQVQSIIPNGEACTPYGSTEALPVTLIRGQEILGREKQRAITGEQGTYVGVPVNGVRLKVIRESAEPIADLSKVETLPPLHVGEVVVSGKNVSPAYLDNPSATALAKIPDGDTFWHRMGDVGYLDNSGHLYFCGRHSHVVRTSMRVYYSVPCERVFDQMPKVRRSALVSLSGGTAVGIAIEPYPQYFPNTAEERTEFIRELTEVAKSSPLTNDITEFFFHPSFPVDGRHNAKIFRDKLGQWADSVLKEIS